MAGHRAALIRERLKRINTDAPRWLVADPTVVNMTIGHLPRRALTSIPLDPADEAG
jgi:hypothetical protein